MLRKLLTIVWHDGVPSLVELMHTEALGMDSTHKCNRYAGSDDYLVGFLWTPVEEKPV